MATTSRSALRRAQRAPWPATAVVLVSVLGIAAALLLFINLAGIRLRPAGRYNSDVGGSVAEWFGALATLVALPVAVVLGLRQLNQRTEERAEDRSARHFAAETLTSVRLAVVSLPSVPELCTVAEGTALGEWRNELIRRGWAAELDGRWRRGLSRSTVEELLAESSPLLPRPWALIVECVNANSTPIEILGFTVEGTSVAWSAPTGVVLGAGETTTDRLRTVNGDPASFATREAAIAAARDAVARLDARAGPDVTLHVEARLDLTQGELAR